MPTYGKMPVKKALKPPPKEVKPKKSTPKLIADRETSGKSKELEKRAVILSLKSVITDLQNM